MIIEARDRIRVQELVLPEPKEKFATFDPETDITNLEWKQLRKDLFKFSDTTAFIEMCGRAEYLGPGRLNNLPSVDRYMPRVLAWFKIDKERFIKGNQLKDETLSSYFFAHKLLSKDDPILDGYDQVQKRTRDEIPLFDYFYPSLLFPNVFGDKYNDDFIKVEKEKIEQKLHTARAEGKINYVAKMAARVKLISPDALARNPLSPSEWRDMRVQLHEYSNTFSKGTKRRMWNEFLELAFNMQILAADEIKHHRGQIEFVMPKNKQPLDKYITLPEWRRF